MALITSEYVREQQILHTAGTGAYGDRGFNWGYLIAGMALIERCSTILDYGCGKGSLGRTLRQANFKTRQYDPGVPEFSGPPKASDLVVSLDVLEHIEPECLDDVLAHLRQLTLKALFVAIATRPAKRFLTDGRNAHLIIEPDAWWRAQLEKHRFEVRRVWSTGIKEWVALMRPR